MQQFNKILLIILLSLNVLGAGTYIKGPALVEGFTTITSAAGTTTLTKDSETKQIVTGSTTQTIVMPDATTLPLGRKFLVINKSSGTVTVNASGGGLLGTVTGGAQAEVHLRAAGSAAGTWDLLSSSAGGGGTWGSITGTLSAQTDLNTALGLKAPLASPTFTGTIGTPLTASKLLATDASGNLTATAANSSQAAYLDFSSSGQTQLNGKLGLSTYSAKGDIVAGVSSGTVSSLTLGGEGSYLLSDPNNISNGVRWGTPAGLTNYIKQSQAEGGVTTGWAAYADAAGTSPVDGTGGSPNSTFSTTSTNPLRGSDSFTFTLNTGASRQGEGVCYPITIDRADTQVPKQQKIEFDYEITSGTFVAGSMTDLTSAGDSTLTVWVVDTTSGQVIQPSTYRLYSNVGDHYSGYFQNNYGSASYRVCLHKGTSTSVSGSNIVVKLDEFKTAPSTYLAGTPISDWQSYTPTGSWSNVTYVGKWRRVGDSMEVNAQLILLGIPTTATLTVSLPSGYTIDTAKLANSTIYDAGLGNSHIRDYTGNFYTGSVRYNNTTSVLFTSDGGGLVTQAAPMTWDAADQLTARFAVPIQGWSASTQMSDGYDGRRVDLQLSTNAGSIATSATTWTTITFSTPEIDDVSCWNGTDTCSIKSAGDYEIGIMAGQNSAAANYFRIGYQKNSDSEVVLGQGIGKAGGSALPFGSKVLRLAAGDTIKFKAFTEGTEGISTTRSAYIKKILAPQTMSATEVVAARYTTAAGQSIPNSSTFTVIDFGTKDYDTHNAVTTGASWKFTAPIAGLYKVCSLNAYSSSLAWTAGNAAYGAIFKGGSTNVGMVDDPPVWASVTDLVPIKGCNTVNLLAGEYINLRLANNRTGGNSALQSSADYNYITIERIK